jgi:LysM repeat protein
MRPSVRTPSRWLAPLALVAVAVAVLAILSGGSGGGSSNGGATPIRPSSTGKAAQKGRGGKTKPAAAKSRTYTVQAGDTLTGIAAKTGLSLTRIEQLNPALDSQALQTGQKVKLGP